MAISPRGNQISVCLPLSSRQSIRIWAGWQTTTGGNAGLEKTGVRGLFARRCIPASAGSAVARYCAVAVRSWYSMSLAFGMMLHLPLALWGVFSYYFLPVPGNLASLFVTNTLSKCRYAGFVGVRLCTRLPGSFFRNKAEPRSRTGPDPGERAVGKLSSSRRRNRRETVVGTAVGTPANCWRKPRFWGTSASLNKGWEGSLRRRFSGLGGGCHKRATSQAQCMYFPFHGGWRNGELRGFRRAGGVCCSTRKICRQNRDFTKGSRLKVCTDFPGPLSGGVRTPWLLREIGTF